MTQINKPLPRGIRAFGLVWFGQLISLIGTGLTSFALTVWTYQVTGSVSQTAFVALCNRLPSILLAPFAGALVDRWDRRWTMFLSDSLSGLTTLSLAALMMTGRFEVWHIYVATTLYALGRVFQEPAYTAATTLLVPEEHYARASGMMQLADAVASIGAPVLAGALIVKIQLQGVIAIDFVTYLFALVTLLLVRFPKPPLSEEGQAAQGSLWREAGYGWRYITQRPGLLGLLLLFTAVNFVAGFINVLVVPLVLSFTTSDMLGTILGVSSVGLLVGSLLISAWGGPKRLVYGVLGSLFFLGICLSLMGIAANAWLIGAAIFGVLFAVPIMQGCNAAIWQRKTPPDVQGRVFATQQMIALSAMPISILLAGPLADRVFEPLLAVGGPLAGSLGALIGVGAGRGIGLMYLFMGAMVALIAVWGYLNPRVRGVDDELPSAVNATVAVDPRSDTISVAAPLAEEFQSN